MADNPLLRYDSSLRTSYLVMLASVATADHENSEAEVAFMQQMASVAQLSNEEVQEVTLALQQPGNLNFQQHLSNLNNSDLKYALVADLINMLYADGDMDQQELQQVARINSALGISEEQFKVMSEYVRKANQNAAQQESTPGLMGLMSGGNQQPSGGGMDMGSLLGLASNFLSQSGMQSQFQQAGIPQQDFQSGSTIGTILTGIASSYIQSQMGGGNRTSAANSGMGDMIGGLVGSMLGGNSQPTQSRGISNTPQESGIGDMISGVLGSPQGQQMVQGLLGQVMGNNQKGQGLPNMSSLLGGGRQNANAIGGLMDMFLK